MPRASIFRSFLLTVFVLIAASAVFADWLKMDPPPDVDKRTHNHNNTSTCWLATASNMLAGAGYGTGVTPQQRADSIYNQMVATHGTGSGWADFAITTWLKSSYNTQKGTNPYTVVTVYGYKTATPYLHNPHGSGFNITDDLPQFIGNELRVCQMLGISLSWGPNTGHIITCWGDSGDANSLTSNPSDIMVTDSDGMDWYGDIQTYKYNKFWGVGWYTNYGSGNSPYIKHIVTLCATDVNDPNAVLTQKIVGSYQRLNPSSISADKILHMLTSNNTILTYKTTVDACDPVLEFFYELNQRKYLLGKWDVSSHPIAQGQPVTVTTEAVLPYDPNAVVANKLTNFILTLGYPAPEPNSSSPGFSFGIDSVKLPGSVDMIEPNQTGGYVIGAFSIFADMFGQVPVGEFRFCSEYQAFENPETHTFVLEAGETVEPTFVGNFRFGHSYGLLKNQLLWDYGEWRTIEQRIEPLDMQSPPIIVAIDWTGTGLLPYPQGENYQAPQPVNCGDPGTEYSPYDFNKDCYVNFIDLAYMSGAWLDCSNPADTSCVPQ
ncbi:MAG: hypothetical protein ACYC54_12025 [Sedimentisphaerales bacterium]